MKCRQHKKKTILDIILSKKDRHNWTVKEISNGRTIYRYRECECGKIEVYSFKYDNYKDINLPWRWGWEEKEFRNLLP